MEPRPAVEDASAIRRIVVILNPASGRGRGARRRAELEHHLRQSAERRPDTPCWEIVETAGPGHAADLAAEAAANGADLVVAVGGDGTCRDVAAGLLGTPARLGLIPLGTGNDLARALGLDGSLERAVETLFTGRPKPLDVGRAQGRPFLVAGGCGFDAVVAARVNRGYPILRGTAAYIAAVVECLGAFQPAVLRLTLDGQPLEARAMLCPVANAPSYGGGMRIAPEARLDDGWLDVCIVGDVGRGDFLRTFPRVFRGTHVSHPKVTLLRAKRIVVESDPPLPVNVDGDVMGTTAAEFTLTPHAISVLAP